LREFHFENNQISDVAEIGRGLALATNSALRYLALQGNQITDATELKKAMTITNDRRPFGPRLSFGLQHLE